MAQGVVQDMMGAEAIDALIVKVAMGDRAGFSALYDRTAPRLYGIARALLRDETLAAEVLENVYVRIWERAGAFRDEGVTGWTWMISLVRNACAVRLRAARASGLTVAPPEKGMRMRGAEGDVLRRDEAEALEACLGRIGAEEAALLTRAYLEGLTLEEIAAEAGTDVARERRALRAAVMKLRECLSQ
jgi:RNA polymerase sigma-70 factor (ECF subfamily)